MSLKAKKVERTALKCKLTRIANYIAELDDKADFDTTEIRVRAEELERVFKKYDEVQTEIEALEREDEDEEDNDDLEKYEIERTSIENKYYTTKAKIIRLIKVNEKMEYSSSNQVRLPQLELPHFSGDFQEWPTFKNLFECAMQTSNVPTLQRLQYLKSSLRGEAANLIGSLLITEENYKKAFEILVARYENKTIIVNFHLKNFVGYPTITKLNLKNFVTVLQQSLDSLSALELPVDQWDVLLVYIITQKLDNSLRAAWELNRKESSIPKMKELKEFLTQRVTAFELMNEKYVERQTQPFKQQSKISHVAISNNSEIKCSLCRNQHTLNNCPNFLEMSVEKRIEFIKNNSLCFNCLQPYNSKHKCSKRFCSTCHGKHHSLIHLTNPPHKVNTAIITNSNNNTCLQSTTNIPQTLQPLQTQNTNTYIQSHCLDNTQTQHINQQNCNSNNIPTQTYLNTNLPQNISHIVSNNPTNTYVNAQPNTTNKDMSNSQIHSHSQIHSQEHKYVTPSSVCISSVNTNQILLSTALIKIQDSTGKWHNARALLDSGSEVHIVTHKLASKLNSKFYYDSHIIQGIGESGKQTQLCINSNIASRVSDYCVNQNFIVMDKITVPLPHNYIDVSALNIPKQQCKLLADPSFYIPGEIDILIGAQLFYSLLLPQQINLGPNCPKLIETVFGWIVSGNISTHILSTPNESYKPISLHIATQPSTDDLLERFWKQEEVKPRDVHTPDQKYCENLFLDTTTQEPSGHYCVEMPMRKDKVHELGDSFNIAYRCLLILESKFMKDPMLYLQYKAFINEFVQLGHAEYVPNFQDQDQPHCYLPHMGVLRPDSRSTKLRAVVNASSKTSSGLSLNDVLFEGPNIYNEVLDILLRFRMYKYAFSCDIIKMFRTIFVQENQRPFLRILWRDSKSLPFRCIQLKTVTYGTKCAPYLACRTLRHMAKQYEQQYPEAAEIVRSECYMDDFLSGGNTIQEVTDICTQLTHLMNKGNFKLHKWLTNEPKVLENVIHSDQTTTDTNYEFTPKHVIKTLGIQWSPHNDKLSVSIPNPKSTKLTKRNVLSVIAQVYDPTGFLSPTMIKAKIIMQDIWKLKLDWDDILPEDIQKSWTEFYQNISHLQGISIPRYYFSDIPTQIMLLGFCDASQKAYGACLYFRATYHNKKPSCSLVIAKTRVAPIKTQSLPRLELCGALLLAHLVKKLLDAFKDKFTIDKILLFCDSSIVLSWIDSPYKKLHTYVSHRLMEILELTKAEMWRYVHTKSNPADLLTRGVSPEHLQQTSLWWNGPQWVIQDTQTWPSVRPTNTKLDETELVTSHVSYIKDTPIYEYLQTYSNFNILNRVFAYVLRFKNILLQKIKKNNVVNSQQNVHLTTHELKEAHNYIIKVVQLKYFSKEISELQKLKDEKSHNSAIPHTINLSSSTFRSSSLRKLNPFLDQDNIIRLGGRISNSDIPYSQANPIILPHKEHITTLIIKQYHLRLLHSGIQNTLCNLRLKYWPINGRNEVKKVIHSCVRCIRYNARACEQQMASLPAPRVSLVRPFQHVGVDFSGAIYVRNSMGRNCRYVKAYICLFVCLSTKALHLELVSDMTSQAFICALKRFINRRGICQCIYSDNATNFKGAHNELNDLYKMFKNDESYSQVMDYCNFNCIQWKFTVPLASHMGGLYEAGIKSVKALLKRHLHNQKLTYELLSTVLIQIEGVLNSRPLCPLKDTPDKEIVCLTPAHFLTGAPISDIPEPNVLDKLENRLSLFQRLTKIKQKFWYQFYCNYLSELQPRSKWLQVKENLKIGDIVLLKDECTPPSCWPLGRVILANKNTKDGLVRSVTIKTSKGEFTRPVNKLILLPTE